jgi:PucR family transcriptional regulator, purine catabolism regulatory protein
MPISVRNALLIPSLAAAEPRLLAGESGLSDLVRWVHTSEVFEIADLLRGGELLLIGGVSLATATTAERQQYLRGLAARGVAGLAIETGRRLRQVPEEMVQEAERLGLPLVELRKVVPFIAVTEAINGMLVNESVLRLQLADRVSRALTSALAAGGDPNRLLDVLAEEADADLELIALPGELIARSPTEVVLARSGGLTAPVSTGGVTVATLAIYPRATSDPLMLEAVRDRAPDVLGVALLRSRPLSLLERNAREFLILARNRTRSPQRFHQLAERLGIADRGPWVGVIGRLGESPLRTSGVEDALRRAGRVVISHLHEESYLAVVALDGGPLGARRADVVAALRKARLPRGVRVAVGPGSRSLLGIGRCLREAEACFDLAHHEESIQNGERDEIVDAIDLSVERLLLALNRSDLVAEFVEEQLGELLDLDARKQGTVIDTLSSYLAHLGNKTDTASSLHIQRQSLYQRLDKIFEVVGVISPGSTQWRGLMLAVEFEAASRRDRQS